MVSPEIPRLTRRVDKHDEDVRYIGDMVPATRATLAQQTGMLTRILEKLDAR